MQDKERETLKENAEQLANLLTENVPYLIGHYLKNGVLTESEREDIIQAESSQEIKIKLVKTLAAKEGISLKAVIEGLNATDNQCVSTEISNLLSDGNMTGEEVADNGSGDKCEDLTIYATNLVDEVIAKAEETTAAQAGVEIKSVEKDETTRLDDSSQEEEVVDDESTKEQRFGGESNITSVVVDADVEEEPVEVRDNLVETSVEVHTSTTEDTDAFKEKENILNGVGVDDEAVIENDNNEKSIVDVNEDISTNKKEENNPSDVPDRAGVCFSETVATIIEDGKHNNQFEDDEEEEPISTPSPTTPSSTEDQNQSLGTQHESENDDVDNIDIEKEFVMPPEAEANINNNNSVSNGNVANGQPKMVRMESNEIVFDNEKKEEAKNTNANGGNEDNELAAILARKALVRQQVEMFEKNSPGPGKIKYSIRSAAKDKEREHKVSEGGESKVKNLKNFFQRLSSTSENSTSSPPLGSSKPVGKLKVTFPATS